MSWSLVRELGDDQLVQVEARDEGMVSFPTFAARASDGTYLISEERGVEKRVPFQFEARTIRVNRAGQCVFDTADLGIDDGSGCLLEDGNMAVLRRTKWELLVLSLPGEVVRRIPLARFSKKMPRFVRRTYRRTYLVVFYNRSRDVDVIEIDDQGGLLWYLPPTGSSLGIVGSAQLTPQQTILIADPFRHHVVEVDRYGNLVWQFGEAESPSADRGRLSGPASAWQANDGRRWVADARNHRIVIIDASGSSQPFDLYDEQLSDPSFIGQIENGNWLICDTGNRAVIEVNEQGRSIWRYGGRTSGQRLLSFPRSVERIGHERYLVADTAHDRVVEIIDGQVYPRAFHGTPPLFWPRCARSLPSGSILIADARNGRIVEVAPNGTVLNELSAFSADNQSFHDPHDVRRLENGHLIVTDSTQDVVVEVDWEGRVYSVIGKDDAVDLDDPHSAQQLPDGSVLISDTGHDRILVVDARGRVTREIQDLRNGPCCYRLHQPRYAEVSEDGTLAIADTGNNRILAGSLDGDWLWEFDRVPTSRQPFLSHPRWVAVLNRDEAVICDHFHHRILQVRRHEKP